MLDFIINYFNNHLFLFLLFIVTIIYFLIASYEDFKKKEVFNFINFSYLFITSFLIILYSISQVSIQILVIGILGLFLGFLLGSILFFLGIWGGGDAKFLIPFGGVFTLLATQTSSLFSSFELFFSTSNLDNNVIVNVSELMFIILAYSLLLINFLIILYILYKLVLVKKINHLYISTLILLIFIIIGMISIFPIIPFEIRLISSLSFIILLFLIPNSSFFMVSKFEKLSTQGLKKLFKLEKENVSEYYLSHPIVLHSKEIEPFRLNSSPLTLAKVEEFEKKGLNNSSYLNVVSIPPIIPFFLFQLLVIMFLLIFEFKEQNLVLLFKFVEFLLLSFLVGGLYVIVLVLYNSVIHLKLIYQSIPNYRFFTYVFSILVLLITHIIAHNILISQISLMGGVIVICLFLFEITKIIEKKIFVIETTIDAITLGDWIVEDVIVEDNIVFKKEDFKLGVEEFQLEILNKLYGENKLKSLKVKSGIAFIPHLFIGFILLIVLNLFY
ncbi:MAG: hypothetical protein LAT82_01710 [Nanoarchaeota archaeon]|nr:hypothetical protein [Nanoarchaeota archaeon]